MSQVFHVVRCFSCSTFQSQQVRKDKKFVCKLCGAKQSVKKEYGRGSGKDCRVHVQKLNALRGSLEREQSAHIEDQWQEEGTEGESSRYYEEQMWHGEGDGESSRYYEEQLWHEGERRESSRQYEEQICHKEGREGTSTGLDSSFSNHTHAHTDYVGSFHEDTVHVGIASGKEGGSKWSTYLSDQGDSSGDEGALDTTFSSCRSKQEKHKKSQFTTKRTAPQKLGQQQETHAGPMRRKNCRSFGDSPLVPYPGTSTGFRKASKWTAFDGNSANDASSSKSLVDDDNYLALSIPSECTNNTYNTKLRHNAHGKQTEDRISGYTAKPRAMNTKNFTKNFKASLAPTMKTIRKNHNAFTSAKECSDFTTSQSMFRSHTNSTRTSINISNNQTSIAPEKFTFTEKHSVNIKEAVRENKSLTASLYSKKSDKLLKTFKENCNQTSAVPSSIDESSSNKNMLHTGKTTALQESKLYSQTQSSGGAKYSFLKSGSANGKSSANAVYEKFETAEDIDDIFHIDF